MAGDRLGFDGVRKTELGLVLSSALKELLLCFEGPLVGVCSIVVWRYGLGSFGSLSFIDSAGCLWTEEGTRETLDGGISSGSLLIVGLAAGRRGSPPNTSFCRLPLGVAVTWTP